MPRYDHIEETERVAKTFDEILKFNPYHDSRGRFTTPGAAVSFTATTRDENKQHWADRAIMRERERTGYKEPDDPRKKGIHQIEDRIRAQNFESAACIDNDGDTVFFKDGEEAQVAFDWAESAAMAGRTLTHNHPSSSTFSKEDVHTFVNTEMREIRATTRSGRTYSLSQTKDYTEKKGRQLDEAFHRKQQEALQHAQNDLDRRGFMGRIMRGEISHDDANVEFRKVFSGELNKWLMANASKYGVDFHIEKKPVTTAHKSAPVYTEKAEPNTKAKIVLDGETEREIEEAFAEWLKRSQPGPRA